MGGRSVGWEFKGMDDFRGRIDNEYYLPVFSMILYGAPIDFHGRI